MIGKILGNRYELLEKVGTGGMAVVYKAKCHLLNRFVAVKMLKDEYVTDQEFLDRFKKEAQAAASLSHQNIVNIYDVGSYEDIPYIVMELVQGDTLKEYIDNYNGFLKNEVIADFAKQIASAIEHAHSNQIIHRDIKPHNILVSKDGTLKVGDFGIASAITESTTSYSTEAIGSVRYSSPEQARGRNVDERTDLYSLGVLMYEMATRKVPFEGDTAVEIALKHMKDDIGAPSEINSTFHKGLESIIMRSLLKDLGQRYQSAKDLIDDLDKVIANPRENVAFYDFNNDQATQKIPSLDEFKIEKGDNRTMKKTTKKQSSKKKSSNKNIFVIVGVILLAFIMATIIFVLTRLEPKNIEAPNYVEIIDVVGKSIDEAKASLEGEGYTVLIGEAEKNNDIPKDYIIQQTPPAGTKVKPGSRITLYPSDGATVLLIPNLTQIQVEDAKVRLENTSFEFGEIEYVNDDMAKGFVLSQTPAPGSEAKEGAVIDFKVSLGPEFNKVLMPKVSGLTINEAQERLLEIGLDIDDIDYEAHEFVEKDKIISQSVTEGTEVEPGSLVSIVVSTGTGEEETEETTDPAAKREKSFVLPLASYAGQTVKVKIMYEKDGFQTPVFEDTFTVPADNPNMSFKVTESGKGRFNVFINDKYELSQPVDFSN